MKSLLSKTMLQLALTLLAVFILAVPMFYYLTEHYYAEDLSEVLAAIRSGKVGLAEEIDIREDVVTGLMIQYAGIAAILFFSIIFTMHFLTRRLWTSFNETLREAESFRLGSDNIPSFPKTKIKEFHRLNCTLENLIRRNVESYDVQKEFTENASHELQTPIAIIRGKLDLLLQQQLDRPSMELVQQMYDVTARMEKLNRSLLILAKIGNAQYAEPQHVDVGEVVRSSVAMCMELYQVQININVTDGAPTVLANRTLLEMLVNNLVVNAVRHSVSADGIFVSWHYPILQVSNRADGGALDNKELFRRFYNPTHSSKGNGLGLAIVKKICDFYHWSITYSFEQQCHLFRVKLE
jgi:two-component system, OmpR family, sensor kinase